MSRGLLFWIIMLLLLVFSVWHFWPAPGGGWVVYSGLGISVVLWVLLALLGWKVYGPAIRGD